MKQSEAAKRIGISRQAIYQMIFGHKEKTGEYPAYVKLREYKDKDGETKEKIEIDEKHPAWIEEERRRTHNAKLHKIDNISVSIGKKNKSKIDKIKAEKKSDKEKKEKPEKATEKKPEKKSAREIKEDAKQEAEKIAKHVGDSGLYQEAERADLQKKIATAIIQEQKAEQEKLKTLQIKKELAPIELVKYYFSFGEGFIQKIYRRPNEIWPDLTAMILGGEEKEALKKLIRELEGIVKESVYELREEMKKEGYKVREK